MLDPNNLIDYAAMFKGEANEHQSNVFRKWNNQKKEVFFKESIYSWKNNRESDFRSLPEKVLNTLKLFNYEI